MGNKLIIGTAQFGMTYGINNAVGQPSAAAIYEMLDLAMANGVSTLDTAEAYGNAHQHIGAYHASGRKVFKIITKYNPKLQDLPTDIYSRVLKNIAQLHVSELEAYMLHSFHDYKTFIKELEPGLLQLKEEGKIKNIGVSVYTNDEFEMVLKDVAIDLIQLPFNVFDNNTRRGDLIKRANSLGKIIHTRSVFLQGLFFMPEAKLPAKLKVLVPALQQLKNLAAAQQCSIEKLCLNYVCAQDGIAGVLIGVESVDQLLANIYALNEELPDSVLTQVEQITLSHPELLNPTNWHA